MSVAYERGRMAAKRQTPRVSCPYAGHSGASRYLRRLWLRGYDDEPKPARRIRVHRIRAKSEYARRRIEQIQSAY